MKKNSQQLIRKNIDKKTEIVTDSVCLFQNKKMNNL